MALPVIGRATVFSNISSTTTTDLGSLTAMPGGHQYAQSMIFEVVGASTPNWTLDWQGKSTPDGTYLNLDYQQIWQAGAAALSNSQLTVNDTTRRFYLVANTPQFVQIIATRTAGNITVHVSHSSQSTSQFLLTTARGSIYTEGPVASDAANAGNPIKIGGVVDDSSPAAAAEGDIRDIRVTPRGKQLVSPYNAAAFADGYDNNLGTTFTTSDANDTIRGFAPISANYSLAPDGSWDRLRTAGNTAGSGQGALIVSPTGHAHNSVTGDEQILSAAGKLHTISIHDITTGGTLTVYDNTAESGTVIATLTLAAGEGFVTMHYDVGCASGLYMGYDSNLVGAFTVSYSV